MPASPPPDPDHAAQAVGHDTRSLRVGFQLAIQPGETHRLRAVLEQRPEDDEENAIDTLSAVLAAPGVVERLSGPEFIDVLDQLSDLVSSTLAYTLARRRLAAEGPVAPAPLVAAFMQSDSLPLVQATLDTQQLPAELIVQEWAHTPSQAQRRRLLMQPAAPLTAWPQHLRTIGRTPVSRPLWEVSIAPWPGAARVDAETYLQALLARPDVPLADFAPLVARLGTAWTLDLDARRLLGFPPPRLQQVWAVAWLPPQLALSARIAFVLHPDVHGPVLLNHLVALLSTNATMVAEVVQDRAGDLPDPGTPEVEACWRTLLTSPVRALRLEAVRRFARARSAPGVGVSAAPLVPPPGPARV